MNLYSPTRSAEKHRAEPVVVVLAVGRATGREQERALVHPVDEAIVGHARGRRPRARAPSAEGRRTPNSPSDAWPGSIIDGHAMTPGTRTPPSHVEPFAQRNGVYAASGHVSISGPLSEVTRIIVSSSCPVSSRAATRRPTTSSSSRIVSLYGCLRGRACPRSARSDSCRSGRRACCGTGTTAASPSPCARRTRSEYVHPLLVELGEDRDRDLLDVLGLAAAHRVDEALVERQVLDPLGPRVAVDDLGEEGGVAPLRVHVRHREEAVEVVEADVLWLGLAVLAHVPLADRLGDVPRVGAAARQRHLALRARRARRTSAGAAGRGGSGAARSCSVARDGRARRLGVARREQEARARPARRCSGVGAPTATPPP